MWYINEQGGNPHYPARDGDALLPDELYEAYIAAKGFARIVVFEGVVTAIEVDQDALDEYEAEHPDVPPPPTDLERIEAQVLYTALMTDTLIEEE